MWHNHLIPAVDPLFSFSSVLFCFILLVRPLEDLGGSVWFSSSVCLTLSSYFSLPLIPPSALISWLKTKPLICRVNRRHSVSNSLPSFTTHCLPSPIWRWSSLYSFFFFQHCSVIKMYTLIPSSCGFDLHPGANMKASCLFHITFCQSQELKA